jgi:hypothetical protein
VGSCVSGVDGQVLSDEAATLLVVGPDWLRKQLQKASPDLLREMVTGFIATLMSAEAEALCNARTGRCPRTG